jgi:hypothetical protein
MEFIYFIQQAACFIKYIYYVNVLKQQIILSDISFPNKFTLSASREVLKASKTVLEECIKNRRIVSCTKAILCPGTSGESVTAISPVDLAELIEKLLKNDFSFEYLSDYPD